MPDTVLDRNVSYLFHMISENPSQLDNKMSNKNKEASIDLQALYKTDLVCTEYLSVGDES